MKTDTVKFGDYIGKWKSPSLPGSIFDEDEDDDEDDQDEEE